MNYVKIFKNSIIDIEKHLTKEDFKDYCDNAESVIAYWEQAKEDMSR